MKDPSKNQPGKNQPSPPSPDEPGTSPRHDSPGPPGVVVWLTGRPAAGKSTLARTACRCLQDQGAAACVLDSDDVRAAMLPPPGYDPDAREQFYATLGQLAAYLAGQGLVVLVPATAHRRAFRARARAAAPAFLEVYVSSPSDECARRDIKGLYQAARDGELQGLPGVDIAYEEPEAPDLVARGGHDTAALAQISQIIRRIRRPNRSAARPAGRPGHA